MPSAARALAQRVQDHTAAGSVARASAAPAGRERLAAMLTAALLGGEGGSELNDEALARWIATLFRGSASGAICSSGSRSSGRGSSWRTGRRTSGA
eukprot:654821-Pyramimonas_sp.AAC.1